MSIIKNQLYVSEDYRINEGLIEFESSTLKYDLLGIEQSCVVAVVGDFGTGKSTALYRIQQEDKDETHRWLNFDAWRYPERKGLWDGLIIEIAKQLGQGKQATRKIDGNKSMIGKWGGILGETFSQFGGLLPKAEVAKIEIDPELAAKGVGIAKKAQEVFGRSPAKRVYELERIFADILVSIKENTIFLTVEDVDRSGSDGLNFLETLNFFIKNNEQIKVSGKKIIVIAPIATKNYKQEKDSYYKCIDIALEFIPRVKSAKKFIEQVFADDALGGASHPYVGNLEAFIIGLFENASHGMNIRKLKAIIRQTDIKYESMKRAFSNVDWRAVLAFEAMRNIVPGDSGQSLFEQNVKGHSQLSQKDIFTGLLMTIHFSNQKIYTYKYANSDRPEDRVFNPMIQSYKFLEYNPDSHSDTSVWMGQDRDFRQRGYIAEYYRR